MFGISKNAVQTSLIIRTLLGLVLAIGVSACMLTGNAYADEGGLISAGKATASLAGQTTPPAKLAPASATNAMKPALSTMSASAEARPFIGTWELVRMKQGKEVTGAAELKKLKQLGLEVMLKLNKNGKLTLNLFGEKMRGTWSAITKNRGLVVMEGQGVKLTRKGNKVTLSQQGASLTFKRRS